MLKKRSRTGFRQITLALVLAAVLAPVSARAGQAKDYAYIFLQGRIMEYTGARPLGGVTVQLASEANTFEVVTDEQGFFTFDKLPVAVYETRIITAEGKVIRAARQIDRDDSRHTRLDLRMGWRGEAALRLEPRDDRAVVVVTAPAPNWSKFRKELIVFSGVAALFVL
jgi:hypothetical protein